MIRINNRDISGIYIKSRGIAAVYLAHRLVWSKLQQAISCYSNGYWIDEYPWVDDQSWTD